MNLMLFIKDLKKKNKGLLYYQTWMSLLEQYNGTEYQIINLVVPHNIHKCTYHRIINYGLAKFPQYVSNFTIKKARSKLIIQSMETVVLPKAPAIKKRQKQPQVKPIPQRTIFQEIIDYLNLCTGNQFKSNSKIAIENINFRLQEGYVFEDFKKVIDIKCNSWIGTEYEQHLNPKTLFGDKFEIYVNEKISLKKSKQQNAYEQVIKATELGFNS